MKKLSILLIVLVLVFGMSLISSAEFSIETGEGASPQVNVDVNLDVEKSASIKAPDTMTLTIPGGETKGYAVGSYKVSSNFAYRVDATIGGQNVDGKDWSKIIWDVSVDGGDTNNYNVSSIQGGSSFVEGQGTFVPPFEQTRQLVVLADLWDDTNSELFVDNEAGIYNAAAVVTLTVSAQ